MHTGMQAYLLSIADEDTGTLVLDAGTYTLHMGGSARRGEYR